MSERAPGEPWAWAGLVVAVLLAGWALGVGTCWLVVPRVVCAPCAPE